MKKVLLTIISIITITAMLAGCGLTGGTSSNKTNKTSSADKKAAEDVSVTAKSSGENAASKLNKIKSRTQYEKTLRNVLDSYYGSKNTDKNKIKAFTSSLDERGKDIADDYASAFEERSNASDLSYRTGQVLVVTDDSVSNREIKNIAEEQNGECTSISSAGDNEKVAVVDISLEYTVDAASDELESDGSVEYAQPNYIYQLTDEDTQDTSDQTAQTEKSSKAATAKATADDRLVSRAQWYLGSNGINASGAWSRMTDIEANTRNVNVGVIDTGVKAGHEDLENVVKGTARFENGKTLGSNGDPDGHGTHVCGLIAAQTNNGKGIASASYNTVNLYVADAESGSNGFMTSDMINAMNWLQNQGVKIINMSLGSPGMDTVMDSRIKSLYNDGILVVCASGNESTADLVSPADSPYVMAVNASTSSGSRASFSNYGYEKDITAPGENIYSTYNGNNSDYEKEDGTSMASPIAASVAAAVVSQSGGKLGSGAAFVRNLKNTLYNSTDQTWFDKSKGFGSINETNAVSNIKADRATTVSSITTNKTSVSVYAGNTTSIEYKVTPANISNATASWSSSNNSIATVTQDGVITGIKAGTATITMTVGGVSKAIPVKVKSAYKKASVNGYSAKGSLTGSDAISTSNLTKDDMRGMTIYMDGYYFTAKKGTTIRMCMQTGGKYIAYMKLYGPSKKYIKRSKITWSSGAAYIKYKIPKTGKYYLQASAVPASDVYGKTYYKGSYRISIMSGSKKVSSAKIRSKTYSSVRISWKKVSRAANMRYRVYIYNSNKKYIKSAYVKSASYKKTGMYSGQRYYFKVRPYLTTSKGKLYGKTSNFIRGTAR
ncbi:MAG: S8 family serine peptidase [Eubacteriaceae bacterium]|nr:S8 family serine peptidase [Eubacteriaceae bacterium]